MQKRTSLIIATAVVLGLSPRTGSGGLSQPESVNLAPLIDGVFDGWKSADVVCLGEGHGRLNDSDLRIAVVRDPRFAKSARVVVVEWANGIHQSLLDRFALDVDSMSRADLAPVWRDAVGAETLELPIYELFLRAIQEVNKRLPREWRVRIIAGDSTIDWRKIQKVEDLLPYMTNGMINRGGNIRALITGQVLTPKLKALAIYGSGHCRRIGMGFSGELEPQYPGWFRSIASFIQERGTEREKRLFELGKKLFELGDQPAYIVVRGTNGRSSRRQDCLVSIGAIQSATWSTRSSITATRAIDSHPAIDRPCSGSTARSSRGGGSCSTKRGSGDEPSTWQLSEVTRDGYRRKAGKNPCGRFSHFVPVVTT